MAKAGRHASKTRDMSQPFTKPKMRPTMILEMVIKNVDTFSPIAPW